MVFYKKDEKDKKLFFRRKNQLTLDIRHYLSVFDKLSNFTQKGNRHQTIVL